MVGIVFFWVSAYFQGPLLLVSGSVISNSLGPRILPSKLRISSDTLASQGENHWVLTIVTGKQWALTIFGR